MSDREEKKKKLRDLARQSKQKADELLEDELRVLAEATQSDLEALRPKITDEQTYQKLIAAVRESTSKNESLAELKDRLEKVGSGLSQVAKVAVKLLKPL
jgi:hypothetical protein